VNNELPENKKVNYGGTYFVRARAGPCIRLLRVPFRRIDHVGPESYSETGKGPEEMHAEDDENRRQSADAQPVQE